MTLPPPRRIRSRRLTAALAVLLVPVVAAVAAPSAGAQQDGLSDVAGNVHEPAINALADMGVFEGTLCGDDIFCPSEPIERSVMAVWLIRALNEQPADAGTTRFADIDATDWQAPYVERVAELEITSGCGASHCAIAPTVRSTAPRWPRSWCGPLT